MGIRREMVFGMLDESLGHSSRVGRLGDLVEVQEGVVGSFVGCKRSVVMEARS